MSFFRWSIVLFLCLVGSTWPEYLRLSQTANGDSELWREASEGGHSCHTEQLHPACRAIVLGHTVAPALPDREGLRKGAAQGTLASLVNLPPLKFPKCIWLIWLLWLLSVNGCICLISYFGSQCFNKFIGFIVACITWLLCIHWLHWLHRLLIRHWLIVFASCHRVTRQSWSRQSSMLRMCLDGHPLRIPKGSGTWSVYHIGCIVYMGHLTYIGFNWGSNEFDIFIFCVVSFLCCIWRTGLQWRHWHHWSNVFISFCCVIAHSGFIVLPISKSRENRKL